MSFRTGLDRLIAEPELRRPLAGKRVCLLAHPASVTADLTHALDALSALGDIGVTAAMGPQHGLRGDKQDNMMESPDFVDPVHGVPVFSLYRDVRRPTGQMMSTADAFLVDLQDLGCRIDYPLWRGKDFKYEYTDDVLAIDVINGSPLLRQWVDDVGATPDDLDALTAPDEASWAEERKDFLLY